MRVAPKVDIAAIKSEGAAHAAQTADLLGKLKTVIVAAVAREEARVASPLEASLHVTPPVVVTLKPGDRSLRGLMPADAAERGALNAFINALPIELACRRERFTESIRETLETHSPEGMTMLDVAFEQVRGQPLRLRAHRVHQAVVEAFSEEAVALTGEVLQRAAEGLARGLTMDDLSFGPNDTLGYGLLRLADACRWSQRWNFEQRVGLTQEQVAKLVSGESIMSELRPADIVARLMRFALTQTEPSVWSDHVPVSRDRLSAIKDKFVAEHEVATPRESAQRTSYEVPAIFERPLSALSKAARARAMSAIVARVKSDYDESDQAFERALGISRKAALAMLDGKLEVSPKPVIELVKDLLTARRISDDSTWWQHTDVDEAELLDLRNSLTAAKTKAPEPKHRAHFAIRTADLLDTVAPEHRSVLAECLTAVTQNGFISDAGAFKAVFKVPRDDFKAMLSGGVLKSPLTARQLGEAVLSFAHDAESKYFSELVSHSRDDVRNALEQLRKV